MRTDELEYILSVGPFGDTDSLLVDRDIWYSGACDMLSSRSLATQISETDFAETRTRIIQRMRVDRAIAGATAERWCDSATERVAARGHLIWPGIWATDLIGETSEWTDLRRAVMGAFEMGGMPPLRPLILTPAAVEFLRAAVVRLTDVLPTLGRAALRFVRQVVVHESPILSAHVAQVPETIFFGDRILAESVDTAAEGLLHEALHEKSVVVRLTRVILAPGYVEERGPRLTLPWTLDYPVPRRFSAWRLMSAGHVYTHIAALCANDSMSAQSRARWPEYASRAQLMLDALRSTAFQSCLGPDGLDFVGFLASALNSLGHPRAYALADQEVTDTSAQLAPVEA